MERELLDSGKRFLRPAKVLITGARTGIGQATAILLARRGFDVFAGVLEARTATVLRAAIEKVAQEGGPGRLTMVELDVTDDESIAAAVATTGPVDVLVNNAGILSDRQATETASIEAGKRTFEVNNWGAIRMIHAVLPAMREAGRGTIVNMSSMLGRVTLGAEPYYVASKQALEGASEILAQETARFGIRVVIVEPGTILTPMLRAKRPQMEEGAPYRFAQRRVDAFLRAQLHNATAPTVVAETVFEAITAKEPRLRYTAGPDAARMVGRRREIPDEEWIADYGIADDEAFFDRMRERFGFDLWREPAK
jgi:NAD(P)-dependent dehydrogenase (short-subunit alcohol dehydrogenase family)